MTIQVTIGKWYAVSGAAGSTVTTPDGSITLCTVPDGGQGYFNAPTTSVETSDDTVKVTQATFNLALAALGLLGGGDSELPKGYIRAEFLELTGVQWTSVDWGANVADKLSLCFKVSDDLATKQITGSKAGGYTFNLTNYVQGTETLFVFRITNTASYDFRNLPRANKHIAWQEYDACGVDSETCAYEPYAVEDYVHTQYLGSHGAKGGFLGRIYYFNVEQKKQLLPALDTGGAPCLHDRIGKTDCYNKGSGSFIVGFTLPQARKLGKLPATGGELTISLPSNWQEDTAVVDALATAEGKGWVLTIQTYEAEAVAVRTFALRRIWVRKRAEQNGSYVAADGTRWQIDWCTTMVGGDPQDHGYEPFRSVEAAVAYWELAPYVDPETEQLLTD